MVGQRGCLSALRCSQIILLWLIGATSGHSGISNARTCLLVGRVVQQSSDVVHEERVEGLGDLLLVGKIQRAVKRDPDTLEMHWTNLDDVAGLLAFEYTIAAATSHTSHVEQLGTVDHMVILATCDANTIRFNLEAQTSLVFPQSGSHPRLHAGRGQLASCVV